MVIAGPHTFSRTREKFFRPARRLRVAFVALVNEGGEDLWGQGAGSQENALPYDVFAAVKIYASLLTGFLCQQCNISIETLTKRKKGELDA
jgi:hypothetical protein